MRKDCDLPRERLLREGASVLTVSELLSAVLGNSRAKTEIAERLLRRYDGDLVRIAEEAPQALARSVGLGPSQGAQLAAVFELGRRWAQFLRTPNPQIHRGSDVAQFILPYLRGEQQEVLYVLCLNAKNTVTNARAIFVGTLNASLVHPREVFRFAVENSAASVILAHNHPSGDPTPSNEDISITKRLVQAGKALEIPVLDHVIVGENSYHSLRESGKLS